jgi:predicted hotdog family 3-hydroxylacyl-ACP dehydratase
MFPISGDKLSALIPQKPPFVFIQALNEVSSNSCKTSYTIVAPNVLVNNGQLSAAGLLENIAQTSGCKLGYEDFMQGKKGKLGFIGEVREFIYARLPLVGEELTTTVIIEKVVFDVTIISGKISIGGEEIAQCRMKVFFEPEAEASLS